MLEETILILTGDSIQESDIQRSYRETSQAKDIKIAVSLLEQKMSQFLQSVNRLFYQAEQQVMHSSGIQL